MIVRMRPAVRLDIPKEVSQELSNRLAVACEYLRTRRLVKPPVFKIGRRKKS